MRAIAVRDGADGLEHIDALLRLRGVDPASLPVPQKRPKHFARGKLRVAVMEELRDGPMTGADLARRVRGNKLDFASIYKRVHQCLNRMQVAGLVAREAGRWMLAQ